MTGSQREIIISTAMRPLALQGLLMTLVCDLPTLLAYLRLEAGLMICMHLLILNHWLIRSMW